MTEPQPIADNLWWVIPGRLAGVCKPTVAELADLQGVGIGAIVSVMDDPANLDLYEQADLLYRWLPMKGGTAPTLEQIEELQDFVEQRKILLSSKISLAMRLLYIAPAAIAARERCSPPT